MSCFFKILSVFFIIALHQGVQGKSQIVGTSSDLQNALNQVSSGDTITLLASDYVGDFVLTAPEPTAKITIGGSAARILGNKTALKITSGRWTIHTLSIASGDVGIDIKGSGSSIKDVTMTNTKHGVNVDGNDHTLETLTIAGGEHGVLVKGDRNVVISCTVSGATNFGMKVESGVGNILESNTLSKMGAGAKGFLIEANSSGGRIISSSAVDLSIVKGKGYELRSTSVVGGVNVLGCNNIFASCTLDKVYLTDACSSTEKNDLTGSNTIGQYVTSPIAL